jgi:Domain of unknown function (DUF1902)
MQRLDSIREVQMALNCLVEAFWDSEAAVWVATSETVPGLATEAPTMEVLMDKLRVMIPELVRLNYCAPDPVVSAVSFQLTSHWEELIEVVS